MGTVAMEFVTQIDETLFNACVPVGYRQQVADINFFIRHPPKNEDQVASSEKRGFLRSVAYFSVAGLWVYLYAGHIQNVLPRDLSDISAHCSESGGHLEQPFCNAFTNIDRCFPFGMSNTTA